MFISPVRSSLQVLTGITLFVGATSASAQQLVSARDGTSRFVGAGASLTAANTAVLNADLQRAEAFASKGRFSDAGRLYRSVANAQRAAGEYPIEPLRQLAVVYFGNHTELAAQAAMELAMSAAEFGDPTTRLHALHDAAQMWQILRRKDLVADCMRQILPLLKSPAIADADRAFVAARIVER